MTTADAITHLQLEFKKDSNYRYSWLANIAMSFKDEWCRVAKNEGLPATPEQIHIIANNAADNFLKLLCSEYASGVSSSARGTHD